MKIDIFNIIPVCILIIDSNYDLVFANRAFLDLCGLKENDIMGKKCYESLHPSPVICKAGIDCPLKNVMQGESVSLVHTHVMPDRTERIFEINASPMKDEGNNIVGVIEVMRDVTEMKKTEKALRDSEKKLRDITSSLGEGVYVLDENGCITFMNPEAELLLGWTEEELMNKKVHDIIHYQKPDGSPLPFEDCPVYKSIKTGKRFYSTEEVFIRKDGTKFPVSLLASPIVDNGMIKGSVSAFRDISIRKKLEEEVLKVQKLESIAALSGGIAHDFNNLLTAIMGYISLSKMSLDPEDKIYKNLSIAEDACNNARNLTYQLLAFARGEELFMKRMSIAELLRDTAIFSSSGSKCKLEFSIPEDLWHVEIDEGHMRQVIHNLIVNACEAMPKGGKIVISAENITGTKEELPVAEGDYVRIAVKDHGIGIKKENLQKIFDPYFTTKKMDFHKGVGLGLSVCYSIIKKHKGYIFVESELGKGTTFYILLPAFKPEKEELRPVAAHGRVLVMEDDEMVGQVVREMLEYIGYEVDYVRNGAESIELYKKAKKEGKKYDAVILDLTVRSGMGGKETIGKLLKIDPDVNAIISSGYVDDPVMVNYKEYGFKGFIRKPYEIEKLVEVLRKI